MDTCNSYLIRRSKHMLNKVRMFKLSKKRVKNLPKVLTCSRLEPIRARRAASACSSACCVVVMRRPSSVSVRARGRRSQWGSAVAPSPMPRPSVGPIVATRRTPEARPPLFSGHPRRPGRRHSSPQADGSSFPSPTLAQLHLLPSDARTELADHHCDPKSGHQSSMDSKSSALEAHPPS